MQNPASKIEVPHQIQVHYGPMWGSCDHKNFHSFFLDSGSMFPWLRRNWTSDLIMSLKFTKSDLRHINKLNLWTVVRYQNFQGLNWSEFFILLIYMISGFHHWFMQYLASKMSIVQGVPKKTHHKVLCNVSSIFSKYEPVSEMHHSQKTEIYTSIWELYQFQAIIGSQDIHPQYLVSNVRSIRN